MMPCAMCAKRLINVGGVRRVYFATMYRTGDAAMFFNAAGIELIPMQENIQEPWSQ